MTNGHDISTMSDIPTPDLKMIIPKMRQSVLKGAKILFTGVIPTNVPPQRSPIWNTARAFGAIIHDKLVPGLDSTNPRTVMRATTHVIAGKPGTVKLKEARRVPGIKIVSPRWLWNCAEQWKWLEERLYPVESEKEPSKETKREAGMKTSERERNELKTEPPVNTAFKDDRSSESNTESKARTKEDLLASEKPGHSRLVSLESRLSVSDEELERMEAEVDAEIGSSSSSSSDEASQDHGESKKQRQGKDSTLKSELFVEKVSTNNKCPGRKRKHAEMEDSSTSNSPRSNPDFHEQSDSNESNSSDSEDELAALLEGSENNTFLS